MDSGALFRRQTVLFRLALYFARRDRVTGMCIVRYLGVIWVLYMN